MQLEELILRGVDRMRLSALFFIFAMFFFVLPVFFAVSSEQDTEKGGVFLEPIKFNIHNFGISILSFVMGCASTGIAYILEESGGSQ